jgi:hypothetical protein
MPETLLGFKDVHLYIDLDACEFGNPCAPGRQCRIHKLRWFLAQLGGQVQATDAVTQEVQRG